MIHYAFFYYIRKQQFIWKKLYEQNIFKNTIEHMCINEHKHYYWPENLISFTNNYHFLIDASGIRLLGVVARDANRRDCPWSFQITCYWNIQRWL